MNYSSALGAVPDGDSRCEFLVWAPGADRVDVQIVSPCERELPLERLPVQAAEDGGQEGDSVFPSSALRCSPSIGYFHGIFDGVGPGTLYFYTIDGNRRRPDPASRFQPQGVHGPSQVIDSGFPWEDGSWSGLDLRDYVIYELHVGAFTPEGTFDALIGRLDELRELGVTAIELMPVGQFPGDRNWGYDVAYPFAVQNSYGGPGGLKRLVNACHRKGLAVVLDVVYNHLGPEGNYLGEFGPYFTDRYRTAWGAAINFDGSDSDGVRRYFIENALYWVGEFHIDALRLDALHAIVDRSACPFLTELSEAVRREAGRLNRRIYLMAESDLNDVRLIRPPEMGGHGLDAHWNDDFHHVLHALLTGERTGYYADFGRIGQLAKAFEEGFVYSGEYSAYRRRRHGSSSRGVSPRRMVVFAQNHDQVGNRFLGDRLSRLVSFESLKLAAGAVILSPFTPLLLMGEEYGETAPFLYFVSHSAPELIDAVRKGRKEEFAAFGWTGDPPDPQAEETFRRSKIRHELNRRGKEAQQGEILFSFYRELLRLRKMFMLSNRVREVLPFEAEKVLLIRFAGERGAFVLLNFNTTESSLTVSFPSGTWLKELDSAEEPWGGSGSRIPQAISGSGEIPLAFAPRSLVFFTDQKAAVKGNAPVA